MKLAPIVEKLKTDCLFFGGRVTGGAGIEKPVGSIKLPLPCAIVVPEPDIAEDTDPQTNYRQIVTERIAVIGCFANTDETGLDAWDASQDARLQLLQSLAGWQATPYDPFMVYDGGADVFFMDRAQVMIAFGFSLKCELNDEVVAAGIAAAARDDLHQVQIGVDAIEPFDVNESESGPDGRGPDGRVEFNVDITGLHE